MSLTTRLSAVFLASLAVVLLGFSLVLFLLVRHHLSEQLDARLQSGMQTLVAAIEVHPNDVEWEPLERHVTLGESSGPDQVCWLLLTPEGRLVDCSRNFEANPDVPTTGWNVLVRQMRANHPDAEVVENEGLLQGNLLAGIDSGQLPGRVHLPGNRTYYGPALILRVGLPWVPVAAALRQLAWTLAGVSGGLWLVGVLLSRLVCRRALRPVIQMAASARELDGETDRTLSVPSSGDELEDLGRAFNGLLGRLQEALQRQQRFTGDASHQLRTPLTALLGQVEVALRQERSVTEYQRVLGVVQRRAEQMRHMVELLLLLARRPAQTELPEMQVVELAEWLDAHLKNWAEHPRAADLRREVVGARDARVRTQPTLLGQLLDNLLDNACKYSAPGSTITVRLEATGSVVELSVADRGCGIRAEELPHLCEPFFRAPEARRLGRPGMGLGLTVVQHLLTVLGGRLEIESRPGEGSRFRIFLPALQETPDREKEADRGNEGDKAGALTGERRRGAAGEELLKCNKI